MYAFKFKNEGKSDLLISEATSGCKCTSTKYPKEVIKPGEEGRIEVTFDPTGIRGFQHKMITVVTNGQPSKLLVYSLFTFEPCYIIFARKKISL